MKKRLIISFLIVSLVGVFTVNLTSSFFSDSETSEGNTFEAGKVDLKIDNASYYNGEFNEETSWAPADLTDHKFFDFTDLKPSDWGEDTISIRVDDNDSWLCADITVTKDDDNDCNEPERLDDPFCTENNDLFDGEVGGLVNIVFWVDDGDNVFETNETPFAEGTALEVLTDAKWALSQSGDQAGRILLDSDLNENGSMVGGQTYWIAKYWCFGNLELAPVPEGEGVDPTVASGFSCDGSDINNAPQTDSLLADISFRAEQARHNEEFLCNPLECTPLEIWADTVEDVSQGTLKNGSPITNPDRTDPNKALGAPDWAQGTGTNFFSLGDEGYIVIKLAELAGDMDGDDLSVHEATNGRDGYPEETANIEVSFDGLTWYYVGTASSEPGGGGDGVSYFDISSTPLTYFQYVKVTDTTDLGPHNATADGFDLDAVDAQSVCLPI